MSKLARFCENLNKVPIVEIPDTEDVVFKSKFAATEDHRMELTVRITCGQKLLVEPSADTVLSLGMNIFRAVIAIGAAMQSWGMGMLDDCMDVAAAREQETK